MRIFCSICKELFTLLAEVCVTRCGHLYHENCFKLWLERSPSCPQCRTRVKGKPDRVYFNTEDAQTDTELDIDSLKAKIDNLLETNAKLKTQNKKLKDSNDNLNDSLAKYAEKAKENNKRIAVLKEQVDALKKEKENITMLKKRNEELEAELNRKTGLERLLKATESEARAMLNNTPVTFLAVHQLCVYVEALKYLLFKSQKKFKDIASLHEHCFLNGTDKSIIRHAKRRYTENRATNTLIKMGVHPDDVPEFSKIINFDTICPNVSVGCHRKILNRLGKRRRNIPPESADFHVYSGPKKKNVESFTAKGTSQKSSDDVKQGFENAGDRTDADDHGNTDSDTDADDCDYTDDRADADNNTDGGFVWNRRRKGTLLIQSPSQEEREIVPIRPEKVHLKFSRKTLTNSSSRMNRY